MAAMAPGYVIGLTATPYRTDQARLSYNHILRRCSIQSLQDDGYLSPYRHVTIDSWDPVLVARTWLAHRDEFGKTVIFFRTAVEGQACLAELRSAGIACDLVSGQTDRDAQIGRFAAGELQVLVAMACLTEGFNDPSLRTVFVRPASRGPTVQMAGRVFRLHPDIPMKTVVQCQRTPLPFPRLARPREQFVIVDGVWRSIGATRRLDTLVNSMRQLAAAGSPQLPKAFIRGRSRRRARPGQFSPERPDQES
jgi:superfamily II DNA or RNA helicase